MTTNQAITFSLSINKNNYLHFQKSEGEIDTSEVSEGDEINVLAPDSPIIKQPLLYSSIFLGVAVVFGLLAHCTLCKRRRNGAGKTFEAIFRIKRNQAVIWI